ncbi:MAG: hypothetical protein HY747_02910, partial [Elusimicrobia bacterium]|nr:hypothetical protein [Elusimicrobiota bacterium]
MGLSPGAGEYYDSKKSTVPAPPPIDPFAKVLADELLKTKTSDYWTSLEISSANPAQDLSQYVFRGFGRAELITLLFIAEDGKQKLKDV